LVNKRNPIIRPRLPSPRTTRLNDDLFDADRFHLLPTLSVDAPTERWAFTGLLSPDGLSHIWRSVGQDIGFLAAEEDELEPSYTTTLIAP
jgi:hypothetical protein